MSTMPWQVQIQGWASDLEHLTRHFTSESIKVLKDTQGEGFVYESKAFANCSTPDDVLTIADEELKALSGILKISRDSREPLRIVAVYRGHADVGREIFVQLQGIQTCAVSGELTVTSTDGQGNIVTEPQPLPKTLVLAKLASSDTSIAKAMRLLAAKDCNSWVGMYRIHEVIEGEVGGEHALKKRNWGSEHDMKRFKHSACSVKVAGDAARHGIERQNPPTHPMSIEEAAAYLNYVVHAWLASKST